MEITLTIALYGLITFVPHTSKPMTYALVASGNNSQHTTHHQKHYPVIAWGRSCQRDKLVPSSGCTVVELDGVEISFDPSLSTALGTHERKGFDLLPLLGAAADDSKYSEVKSELVAVGNLAEPDAQRLAARINLINGALRTDYDGRGEWWFQQLGTSTETLRQKLARGVEYKARINLSGESPLLKLVLTNLKDRRQYDEYAMVPSDDEIRVFVVNQPAICGWIDEICRLSYAPHFQMLYDVTAPKVQGELPIPFNYPMGDLYCENERRKWGCQEPSAEVIRGTGPIFCPAAQTLPKDYTQ